MRSKSALFTLFTAAFAWILDLPAAACASQLPYSRSTELPPITASVKLPMAIQEQHPSANKDNCILGAIKLSEFIKYCSFRTEI